MARTEYKVRRLANGFIRIELRGSGLVALANADGSYRHGVRSVWEGALAADCAPVAAPWEVFA